MYIVLETQTSQDNQVGTLIYTFEDKAQAESKYHDILHHAAISNLLIHSAFLLTDSGSLLKSESYNHPIVEEE